MNQTKGRDLVTQYYAEHFNFGGKLRTRKEIYGSMAKEAQSITEFQQMVFDQLLKSTRQYDRELGDYVPDPARLDRLIAALTQPLDKPAHLSLDETIALVWDVIKVNASTDSQARLSWLNGHASERHRRIYQDALPDGSELDGQQLINAIVTVRTELERTIEHDQRKAGAS